MSWALQSWRTMGEKDGLLPRSATSPQFWQKRPWIGCSRPLDIPIDRTPSSEQSNISGGLIPEGRCGKSKFVERNGNISSSVPENNILSRRSLQIITNTEISYLKVQRRVVHRVKLIHSFASLNFAVIRSSSGEQWEILANRQRCKRNDVFINRETWFSFVQAHCLEHTRKLTKNLGTSTSSTLTDKLQPSGYCAEFVSNLWIALGAVWKKMYLFLKTDCIVSA